ncbi:PREDICTED: uncharacterized protein LOC108548029 [Eufriesea mexicana]|uniref:uncharacterized protein LOC108548029 n=1 Tax=Eufriesea mexicana TaxID=516756 RepID=UPI00083C1A71|nr:PREDICTED: uncharacterized protein LOC108548029 [Eufriesea mexicana]
MTVFTRTVLFMTSCQRLQPRSPHHCNRDSNVYVVEDQRNRVDPLIEKIFRAPSERRNDAISSKCNIETEPGKTAVQAEDASKSARVKRDNLVKKSNSRSLNEAAKSDEKRSIPRKVAKLTSRIGRASRESAKLPDKDYEVPVDQDRSEYADEAEEEPAINSKNKETRYKGSETHSSEDSAGFIDQEERSSLYDDFETKDVVKRGISGAEDYEEMDEEAAGGAEDSAILEDNPLDEEAEKRMARGDVRVKREYENLREADTVEAAGKSESSGTSADSSGDSKAAETPLKRGAGSEKDNTVVENQASKMDKESNDQEENSKRNVPEKNESDMSKVNSDRETDGTKQSLMANDQTEIESGESGKLQNQEGQQIADQGKTQETSLSGNGKVTNDLASDSSDLKGTSKAEESKIADVANKETAKVDVPANVAETRIQRKIDSIKEEIKREIAEKRRIRDIEENNAKFDELHEQEDDDDEEQALEAEAADKRDVSKRSVRNAGKIAVRDKAEKPSIKRKKRQGDNGPEKVQGASDANSSKKPRQTTVKKRSMTKSQSQTPIVNEVPIKRQYPREIFLVRNDRKKKRRRRSKNPNLISDQRTAKLEDNLPGDFPLDSSLRGGLGDAKSSARKVNEDEKAIAEHESMLEKKSGSVASLTGSNEVLGPLATEYGDAFGGLNNEPGVALARFKRIKRVLRPPTSKM